MVQRVDDLILINYIDAGCFSEIYLSKKQDSNEILATKKIAVENIVEEPFLKKYLENEIIFLKEVNHPNIIKLFDVKIKKDYIYEVMEYCNGGALSEALEKYKQKNGKPFTEDIVKFLMKQILSGVECLHKHGIIHRDLKLDNILLKYNSEKEAKTGNIFLSQVKIIDFNISTRARSFIPIDDNATIIPNMINDEFGDNIYDEKFDIWSLGLLCYELLFGDKLYEFDSKKPMQPPDIIIFPQTISFEAQNFLLSMFKKKGEKRLNVSELLKHEFILGKKDVWSSNRFVGYSKTPIVYAKRKLFYNIKPEYNTISQTEHKIPFNFELKVDNKEIIQNRIQTNFDPQERYSKLENETKYNYGQEGRYGNIQEGSRTKFNFRNDSKYNIRTENLSKSCFSFGQNFQPENRKMPEYELQSKYQYFQEVISDIEYKPRAIYKIYYIGQNIDNNQLKIIVNYCNHYYTQKKGTKLTAKSVADKISESLGDDWLVMVSNLGGQKRNFNLNLLKNKNSIAFSINNKLFHVCRY